MKMKRITMAVSLGLAAAMLAACGSSSKTTTTEPAATVAAAETTAAAAETTVAAAETTVAAATAAAETTVAAATAAAETTVKAGAAPAGGSKTIGVAVADQKSLFYIAAVDGMKTAAEKLGVKLIVLSADNDANKQVNQVNDLLTQKIDALVFIAQDATAAAAGVKAANKAGVPVIAVDEKPESGNGQLATYIATDSVKAADALCQWMFDKMGGSGEIGILRGVLGATAELQRSKGCEQALSRNPGIKVVGTQSANWDETQGYKATQNMLAANPGIKAIFGESDAMGLGAAKAARDAKRTIIAVGIDGFPTMVTAIKEGLTQATQAQVPYKMGQLAIDNSLKAIGGEKLPAEQYQDTVLVTNDNVSTVNPVDFYGPNVK